MDFFDLFNHPNFNSANLEGTGFTVFGRRILRGSHCQPAASRAPCSPTNNVITSANTPTGFGQAGSENLNQGRTLQYSLKVDVLKAATEGDVRPDGEA